MKKTKQIIFTAVHRAELLETELRELREHDVLVDMEYTVVSGGTERANITGSDTVSWVSGPKVSFPRTGGYSTTGVVIEVGEGVQGLAVGVRVAMSWTTHNRYVAVPQNINNYSYR